MSNDADNTQSALDLLLSLDPLEYTDQDLDTIIALNRRHRANLEGGVKPSRTKIKAAALKADREASGALDLADVIAAAVPKPTITRRSIK